MVAVIDADEVVHVLYMVPDQHTVGSTWCQMDVDIGYYPGRGQTVMWVVKTTNVPTCLACVRETEHEYTEAPVRHPR
jgi:hypothetical protein